MVCLCACIFLSPMACICTCMFLSPMACVCYCERCNTDNIGTVPYWKLIHSACWRFPGVCDILYLRSLLSFMEAALCFAHIDPSSIYFLIYWWLCPPKTNPHAQLVSKPLILHHGHLYFIVAGPVCIKTITVMMGAIYGYMVSCCITMTSPKRWSN